MAFQVLRTQVSKTDTHFPKENRDSKKASDYRHSEQAWLTRAPC